jgi:hypothetical protein
MKLARACLVLTVLLAAGLAAVAARSAVHPKVTRAQAVKRLGRMLHASPKRVHLVYADVRASDVSLEWTAAFRSCSSERSGGTGCAFA